MNTRPTHLCAIVLLGAAAAAHSQSAPEHKLGEHPAVLVQRQHATIDANTFIVAHPAHLSLVATPSPTYDHPAVAVQRLVHADDAGLAAFMAQPPVAANWLRRLPTAVAARGSAHGG